MDGHTCDDMARHFAMSSDDMSLTAAEYAVAAAYLRVHEGCRATETWMMDGVACSDGTIEAIPSVIAARIACADHCMDVVRPKLGNLVRPDADSKDSQKIIRSAWEFGGVPGIYDGTWEFLLLDELDDALEYGEAVLKPVVNRIQGLAGRLISDGVVTPAEIQQLVRIARGL